MSQDKLDNIIGGISQVTVYEFIELVCGGAGVKYSEPHARRLLRSFGFSVNTAVRTLDHVPPGEDLEIWQKGAKKVDRTTRKRLFYACDVRV